MSMVIKGKIGIGYYNASRTFEFTPSDLGMSDEDWLELSNKEQQEVLDECLDTEISNVLDAAIWVEGEED